MKKMICAILLVFALLAPTAACAEAGYLSDQAGLLTAEQARTLEEMAGTLSESCGVGIYIAVTAEHKGDIYEVCHGFYHEQGLGLGEGRNGLLLMLSMAERDYALFCYGEQAAYAFDRYGLEKLEKVFLDDFADDSWYGGLRDFVSECGRYLQLAGQGKPVRAFPVLGLLLSLVLSVFAGASVCAFCIHSMKGGVKPVSRLSVRSSGGLELTEKLDEQSSSIKNDYPVGLGGFGGFTGASDSGGSVGRSGGGGHGRSGKF